MKELKDNSDLFIIQQIKNDEEFAFDFIFKKYYEYLCAISFIYFRDESEAENVVQDCFVRLWESRYDLKESDRLKSLLAFMVRNKSIDESRKRKVHNRAIDWMKYSNEFSEENLVVAREFEEKLMEAIVKLPNRSRVAFEYSRFEGMTYAEIANDLGVSVKTVEADMGKALRILRTELSDFLPLFAFFFDITN